jgi:hypothetical protein
MQPRRTPRLFEQEEGQAWFGISRRVWVGGFDLEAAFESLVVVVVRHADGERTAIEGGQDLREQIELVDAREVAVMDASASCACSARIPMRLGKPCGIARAAIGGSSWRAVSACRWRGSSDNQGTQGIAGSVIWRFTEFTALGLRRSPLVVTTPIDGRVFPRPESPAVTAAARPACSDTTPSCVRRRVVSTAGVAGRHTLGSVRAVGGRPGRLRARSRGRALRILAGWR